MSPPTPETVLYLVTSTSVQTTFQGYYTESVHQVQTCNCWNQDQTYYQINRHVTPSFSFADTLAEVSIHCYLYYELED